MVIDFSRAIFANDPKEKRFALGRSMESTMVDGKPDKEIDD